MQVRLMNSNMQALVVVLLLTVLGVTARPRCNCRNERAMLRQESRELTQEYRGCFWYGRPTALTPAELNEISEGLDNIRGCCLRGRRIRDDMDLVRSLISNVRTTCTITARIGTTPSGLGETDETGTTSGFSETT